MANTIRLVIGLSFFVLAAGCAVKKEIRDVPPPEAASPVEGVWEYAGEGGRTMQMVFEKNGTLVFRGGMEYYNPARWFYDPGRGELKLTLNVTPGRNLQIFQMYVGQGVESVDLHTDTVTYAWTPESGGITVGGWIFSKDEPPEGGLPADEDVQLR